MGLYSHGAFWNSQISSFSDTVKQCWWKRTPASKSQWFSTYFLPENPIAFGIICLLSAGVLRNYDPHEDECTDFLTNTLDAPSLAWISSSSWALSCNVRAQTRHPECRHLHGTASLLWLALEWLDLHWEKTFWDLWVDCLHELPAFLLPGRAASRTSFGMVITVHLVCLSSLNARRDWKEAIIWDAWPLAVSSWLCEAQKNYDLTSSSRRLQTNVNSQFLRPVSNSWCLGPLCIVMYVSISW